MRAKQNERGCPNRWLEIFFWKERTSKTRRVGLLGLPEQKIVTSVIFLEQAHLLLQIVDFDGRAQHHPSRRRDQASSLDSPLFKSMSKASFCLLYSWGVNWCD
jgi:hypothetical protein